jgi:hypothetical protein
MLWESIKKQSPNSKGKKLSANLTNTRCPQSVLGMQIALTIQSVEGYNLHFGGKCTFLGEGGHRPFPTPPRLQKGANKVKI